MNLSTVLAFGLAGLLASSPAETLAKAESAIAVTAPWIATPPNGAPTAAGYAVIQNRGRTADALLAVSTPAAARVELHSMSSAGGIMRMRMVTGVSIAPGQTLTLSPAGGYHLMFVRPKRPFKLGERIPATLAFAKAGTVKTSFVVQAAPPGMTMR